MEQEVKTISSDEGLKIIEENKSNPDFVVLDVRTEPEFKAGHLKNAVNLDIYSPDFMEDIDKLNKEKIYLVYCQSGRRSLAATEQIMRHLGFQHLYHLAPGFRDWEAKSYPIEK